MRNWSDANKAFSVKAELVEIKDEKVILWKENGVKISVPVEKLCIDDRKFLGVEIVEEIPIAPDQRVKNGSIPQAPIPQLQMLPPPNLPPRPVNVVNEDPSISETRSTNEPNLTSQFNRQISEHNIQEKDEKLTRSISNTPKIPIIHFEKKSQLKVEVNYTFNSFDWLAFLLACSIPLDTCQMYASKFVIEKMDKETLEYIDRIILKEMGITEGDVARILKGRDVVKKRDGDEERVKKENLRKIESYSTQSKLGGNQMMTDEAFARKLQEEEILAASNDASSTLKSTSRTKTKSATKSKTTKSGLQAPLVPTAFVPVVQKPVVSIQTPPQNLHMPSGQIQMQPSSSKQSTPQSMNLGRRGTS